MRYLGLSAAFAAFALAGCMHGVGGETAAAVAKPQAEAPDPAVIHANANRVGDIGYTEGYFGEGETRLHYVEAGSGPLIILYHGFPSFWYSWFDQMEALKGEYRVVAVDGLGSGLSAKPLGLEHYDIAILAAQLDAFSRHIGGDEKYILMGHDWGSVLALSYAQAYPDRLHKVVGMSAPPLNHMLNYVGNDPEQQRRTEYMQRFKVTTLEMLQATNAAEVVAQRSYAALAERGDLTQEEVALFHADLSSNERLHAAMHWYRANIPAFDAVADEDMWPGPDKRIAMPGLFIWGDKDQIFVDELIDRISVVEPMVETVRIPGVNHWVTMEDSELTTQAIKDFLADQSGE
ncbi:alpha/beta fold hydrolase [Altererythrobacter sp. MF3-039]|uniref:alpha/beta fold hydrolase n=1 Tax=Altererythrobacter sp. MF3-039 TaxID=3252901 RepID=UPI00390C939F